MYTSTDLKNNTSRCASFGNDQAQARRVPRRCAAHSSAAADQRDMGGDGPLLGASSSLEQDAALAALLAKHKHHTLLLVGIRRCATSSCAAA